MYDYCNCTDGGNFTSLKKYFKITFLLNLFSKVQVKVRVLLQKIVSGQAAEQIRKYFKSIINDSLTQLIRSVSNSNIFNSQH